MSKKVDLTAKKKLDRVPQDVLLYVLAPFLDPYRCLNLSNTSLYFLFIFFPGAYDRVRLNKDVCKIVRTQTFDNYIRASAWFWSITGYFREPAEQVHARLMDAAEKGNKDFIIDKFLVAPVNKSDQSLIHRFQLFDTVHKTSWWKDSISINVHFWDCVDYYLKTDVQEVPECFRLLDKRTYDNVANLAREKFMLRPGNARIVQILKFNGYPDKNIFRWLNPDPGSANKSIDYLDMESLKRISKNKRLSEIIGGKFSEGIRGELRWNMKKE